MSTDLESRVAALEAWKGTVELTQVGMNFQQKYLEERFDRIDRRLDRYDAHISKALWVVGSALILAVVAFIIRGGLAP